MTISGILMIIWYAIKPWLGLGALLLALLIAAQVSARLKGYTRNSESGLSAKIVPPIVFVGAFFFVPWATKSSISYVNTWVDWSALIAAAVAMAVYAWLLLRPLCYLRRRMFTLLTTDHRGII